MVVKTTIFRISKACENSENREYFKIFRLDLQDWLVCSGTAVRVRIIGDYFNVYIYYELLTVPKNNQIFSNRATFRYLAYLRHLNFFNVTKPEFWRCYQKSQAYMKCVCDSVYQYRSFENLDIIKPQPCHSEEDLTTWKKSTHNNSTDIAPPTSTLKILHHS